MTRSRSARTLCLDCLESRRLLSGVSVSGATAIVTPAPTGPNVAVVSYQIVGGVKELDVNLNGVDNDFSLAKVGFVYYEGASAAGPQTFINNTSLHTIAWGGSGSNLFVSGGGAQDEFIGGAGPNTFDAGSGYDVMIGGSGPNVFNEAAGGSGEIVEEGPSNTVNMPLSGSGRYLVV